LGWAVKGRYRKCSVIVDIGGQIGIILRCTVPVQVPVPGTVPVFINEKTHTGKERAHYRMVTLYATFTVNHKQLQILPPKIPVIGC
jgi:hypothetical protein